MTIQKWYIEPHMTSPAAAAPPLIGEARALHDTLAHVSAVAPLDRPLLIIGERGVGKELIAARVHFLSRRWDRAFLKLNCAALSDDVLESELFGHEPGAFTGAARRHAGRFERADAGTLFLDEIAAASTRTQEKILRVIEYGEYERLGGGETLTCDVRVVSATNVDLPALTAAGRFRADLLDRLAFDVVTVPPLRARRSDIPVLAAHFGQGIALELGAAFHGFAPEALARLSAWDWPGNVRELKNAVERSVYRHVATGPGAGPVADVCLDPFESPYRPAPRPVPASPPAAAGLPGAQPEVAAAPQGGYDFAAHVAAVEKTLLGEALAANGGNQRRTARHLRLSYDQCRGLLRKHGLAGRAKARSPDLHEPGDRPPAPAVLTGPT